jgi:hypothetical protein
VDAQHSTVVARKEVGEDRERERREGGGGGERGREREREKERQTFSPLLFHPGPQPMGWHHHIQGRSSSLS